MKNEESNQKTEPRQAEPEHTPIELRSEKMRNIIGQPPSFLIRWGNTVMIVILILLSIAGYFLTIY